MKEVHSGETVSGVVKPAWSDSALDTTALPDGVREFTDGKKFYYLNVLNGSLPGPAEVARWKEEWAEMLGRPAPDYEFPRKCELYFKFSQPGYDGELYRQNNAPGKVQETMLLLPRQGKPPYPVVIMPFYVPSHIIGFDPKTGDEIPVTGGRPPEVYKRGAMLAEAGFAVLTCQSYYRTYIQNDMPESFDRWACAARALLHDNPGWSGVGKLVADNRLLADFAEADPRLDRDRIAIMGHSLGGKIAFYTGCLEPRIKCAVASDWGLGWHQTNWEDIWYWGEKVKEMEKKNMEHSQLLAVYGPPLLVIAGHYDDEGASAFLDRAAAVRGEKGKFLLDHHCLGHRIPPASFANAVKFLKSGLGVEK